jgi:regulatory protein
MAGRITAIRVQKRDPNRASVFIDGQFSFGLAMAEAAKLSLGQYLDDREIAALEAVDEGGRAYEGALQFLSYRPRSRSEVFRRLTKRGFSEPAIELALDRLTRAGLLDDRAFAEYWIGNRERFKPRGRYALRHELRQKGVPGDIIDALLEEVDESESAYRAALERLDRWRGLDEGALQRKMSGYLQRRGFGYAVIQEVWERVLAERVADESDTEESEDTTIWDQDQDN